jgi:hypothetical protein
VAALDEQPVPLSGLFEESAAQNHNSGMIAKDLQLIRCKSFAIMKILPDRGAGQLE